MKGKPLWHNKQWVDAIPDLDKRHHIEIENLYKFCNEIVEGPNIQYLKNYVLIRLCSIIEGYQKAIVTGLVDTFEITPSQVLGHHELKIDLDSITEDFDSTNITKGKLVTTSMTATNPHSIYEIFTGINQVKNFSKWFEEVVSLIKKEKGWWHFVKDVLVTRNAVVHNLTDVKDTTEELKEKIDRMYDFANYSLWFSVINLLLQKDRKKEAAELCSKRDIKIRDFESITNDHLTNKAKRKNNIKKPRS